MLKKFASKAEPKTAPEAYPQGYVEDAFEGRTPLAGFLSILPLDLELGVVQPCIHPLMPDQCLVRPIFDNSTVVYDNDSIDAMNCGETMGDDDRRSPFSEIVQGLTNLDFGLRIDIGRRLIEHDDRRVLE